MRIAPYSDAYFDALSAVPDLAALFAVGDRVIVVGRAVVIELTASGRTHLTRAQMDALRRGW
jgi:hypothetical protein